MGFTIVFSCIKLRIVELIRPKLRLPNIHPINTIQCTLAALLHYDLDIPFVIRYAGNNYTGAHRNVPYILQSIRRHVPQEVFRDIERLLTVGAPDYFVGEALTEIR